MKNIRNVVRGSGRLPPRKGAALPARRTLDGWRLRRRDTGVALSIWPHILSGTSVSAIPFHSPRRHSS